ncbi:hypothetical protein GCM10008986_16300 [Salinibacillus aidingensis]|uniref:IrrE N-terminal-like domain-containing protein n=1 Tax=Salinibacillus aidingensis TaxID=237684 RepID=A0ABP3L116_9BACI
MDNRTEKYVKHFYLSQKITHPTQLSINKLLETLPVKVNFWDFTSEAISRNEKYIIFLNINTSIQKQWQDFGHELCHVLWHVGHQLQMPFPFRQLQEWQANYFSYHFCVPTFMLEGLTELNIYKIMKLFNVEYGFAARRLEMYQNKFFAGEVL